MFELFFVFFDVILNLAVGNGNIFIVDAAVLEGNIVDIGEVFFLVVFHFGFGIGNAETCADKAEIHSLFSIFDNSIFLHFPLSIGLWIGVFEGCQIVGEFICVEHSVLIYKLRVLSERCFSKNCQNLVFFYTET